MEKTEKSLMPQLSTPVERKLLDIPAKGENGAAVEPSFFTNGALLACLLQGGGDECYKKYPMF